MSNFDRLPKQRVLSVLRETQRNHMESKAAQVYGGDALRMGRVFSENEYDIAVPVVPPSGNRVVRIEFTPSDLTFGGAPVYKLIATLVDSSGMSLRTALRPQRQRPVGSTQVWLLNLTSNNGQAVGIKFYFQCIGSGTFTATVLN